VETFRQSGILSLQGSDLPFDRAEPAPVLLLCGSAVAALAAQGAVLNDPLDNSACKRSGHERCD
jgi:hypothetical protein